MQLRQAYADALRLVRSRKGLSQSDLANGLDASYISRLESAQSAVTLEASESLAQSMEIQPLSLLALVYAIKRGVTPHEILQQVSDELGRQGYINANAAADRQTPIHPQIARGVETTQAVQTLKQRGLSQAQAARELGISTSTVGRHWNRSAE